MKAILMDEFGTYRKVLVISELKCYYKGSLGRMAEKQEYKIDQKAGN